MSTAELPGQQIQPPSRTDLRDDGVTTKGRHPARNNGMIPGTQITPLLRADIPELSQFLINDPATSYRFSHEVLLWEYFDGPRGPSESLTSSLIVRSAGKIIGHVGMCNRCFAATPSLHAALFWNAFAKSGERNVYVRDKHQSLPRDLPFGISMLDRDRAIL